MDYPLAEKKALENFYVSVQFANPALAQMMSDDIRTVAIHGLSGDRAPAYDAVHRLREQVLSYHLPVFARILDHALEDLGYSLLDIERMKRIHTTMAKGF